ncbi:gastrokine-1-like [Ambystoma mexicanum]|uniref:gastrokine-1-like n=1 Tax=Ambystoma mexicanum TaxID=8296 RepID=UPI0037E84C9A
MKTLILALALLGVLQTQAAPNEIVKVSNPSMNVDKENNVVSLSYNLGWRSWDAVLDYKTGFIATRIFSRKACVLIPMNKKTFPSAELFPAQIASQNLKYSVWQSPVQNLAKFGKNIEALCDGIQTYPAVATGDLATFSECANSIIITILGMTICF